MRSPAELVAAKQQPVEAVVDLVPPDADVIVPLANGEPRSIVAALDAAAADGRLQGVRIHQMHAIYDHPHLHGAYGDRLRHVSYFLGAIERAAYAAGGCQLVPAHFSGESSRSTGACPAWIVRCGIFRPLARR